MRASKYVTSEELSIFFLCCSSLSEKMCLQEDDQPKTFRPARLIKRRFQRPKPKVDKAAERKEVLASQQQLGANVEKNENDSDVSTLIPPIFFIKYISFLSLPPPCFKTVMLCYCVHCSLNTRPYLKASPFAHCNAT